MLYSLLAVFIGGGVGSVLRWLICGKITSHWGTVLVNVIGAFLIGCAYNYFQRHLPDSGWIKLFLMTGLLGGFTTFSTYLLNFSTLLSSARYEEAFLHLFLSLIIGFVFLLFGMKIMPYIA